MLKAQGVDFNEAMVFGLASALTFVYIPLVKINGLPLISYRMPPRSIIKMAIKAVESSVENAKVSFATGWTASVKSSTCRRKIGGFTNLCFLVALFPA
ncbi:BtrH N-terminal domain-containing protein [Aggregatibacter aphrophilus]|uniref:BtrH N-terminal domain-containing protein n=1 Tax=Aggregatibacter aphrophilus TaxID=732 RepID=UPI0002FF3381|nr:BtrH N-terminal domain-containing protein [Aggregatibacter aphrophilus]